MKYLLVDESKSKNYILCVVEIDSSFAAEARKLVRSVRKKGQSTVHFVKESKSRKREILGVYKQIDLKCINYIARGKSETVSRNICMKALIEDLNSRIQYCLIFDHDENYVSRDKVLLRDLLGSRGLAKNVSYSHREPSSENLLWVPDALGWVVSKGSEWNRFAVLFDITVKTIP